MTATTLHGRTILYLVTEDWYFWSHRLNVARAARGAGARVIVATSRGKFAGRIASEGFEFAHVPFDRSSLNPLRDLKTLATIWQTYRKYRPDLVHHVAAKPIFYGSIAARLTGVPAILNAIAGMGFLFMDQSPSTRLARRFFETGLRSGLRQRAMHVIVQNSDDYKMLRKLGIPEDHITVVPGSGIDLDAYPLASEPPSPPVVAVCAARMLWSKGILELVEAARILAERCAPIRIRILGSTDANPSRIPGGVLRAWQEEGIVELAGHSDDVAGEYARAHIAVLPSYREGLPKALLEAASCGRPLIATDVPGCREICRDGQTGMLVPPRDAVSLANALELLARDPELRRRLGRRAREVVKHEYASSVVENITLDTYSKLLT